MTSSEDGLASVVARLEEAAALGPLTRGERACLFGNEERPPLENRRKISSDGALSRAADGNRVLHLV